MPVLNRTATFPALTSKARHRAARQPTAISQAARRILTEILPCPCRTWRCRVIWASRSLILAAGIAFNLLTLTGAI